MTNMQNSSYLSKSKLNMSGDGTNNDRMQKLAEKLGRITTVIENEKSTKFEQYEQKTVNIYNSIEETKENNNTKFNDVKEQILVIQKTLEDDSAKREAAHNEFMDFMKKMEEKIFVCTDFDELFETGWCQVLRDNWEDTDTRCHYTYAWSHNLDGEPTDVFKYDKIHTKGYHWKFPVHEVLVKDDPDSEEFVLN